jgi:hypothetical protein
MAGRRKTESRPAKSPKLMLKKAERTIAAIEKYLERWDSAAKRPQNLLPQVARLRQFHDVLVRWREETLRKKSSEAERARELMIIFDTYG